VIKQGTLRELGSLLVQYKWKFSHLDIKTMLLNGKLKEEVYIFQPKGFEVLGQEEKICKLLKALFGLKQAPQAWYEEIDISSNTDRLITSVSTICTTCMRKEKW
jgi:hypothetical protein